MISLRHHNVADYVAGVFLIMAPYLFGFSGVDSARNAIMMAGSVLIIYSLFTNYYYAVARVIPLGLHMTFDVLLGLFVLLAPAALGYRSFLTSSQEYLHYVVGFGLFFLVVFTAERTEAEKQAHNIHIPAV